jgi:peptidoglycan/LPS O-acetylase OafA/YrhL
LDGTVEAGNHHDVHRTSGPTARAGRGGVLPVIGHATALDGLRGAAVAAVVLFHAGHLRGGYLGVDAFFVLSGFLITSLLLAEHAGSGRISLGGFWARRARRLLPALLLLLLGVAVYAAVWATPAELPRLQSDTWWTLAYAANWHAIIGHQGYWAQYAAPSALEHTWSLAIEEQFYLVWPLITTLVLLRARRRGATAMLVVSLVSAALFAALMIGGAHAGWDPSTLYMLTFTRAPALLLGAALAAWAARRSSGVVIEHRRAQLALEIAGAIAAAFLAASWVRLNGTDPALYRGRLLLCGIAMTVLIAAAVQPASSIGRALSWRPLAALGLISYGVYLWHWPVDLVVTTDRTGFTGWWLVLARVAVTLAIALASYHLVERPVRAGTFRPRTALVAAVVAPLVVAAAIVPATATSGSAATPGVSVSTVPTEIAGKPVVVQTGKVTNNCSVADLIPALPAAVRGRGPRVMIVGDSLACFLGAEMERHAPSYGIIALNRSELGCLMVRPQLARYGNGPPVKLWDECSSHWPAAVASFRPNVTMVFVGGLWDAAYVINGRNTNVCDPAFLPWYASGTHRALAMLQRFGGRVVVVKVPHQAKMAHFGPGIPIPSWWDDNAMCVDRALMAGVAATPGATMVDLDPFVCPDGQCLDRMHGIVLRPDGRHFQGPAAKLVTDWLVPQVLDAARGQPGALTLTPRSRSRPSSSP